jgi:BioD-like phosphotransacetylase family protein
VLTRNVLPHPKLMAMIAQTKIPVVTCRDESFEVATKIHEMTIKTTATDSEKISIIKDLITKNIDLNVIKSAFDDRKIQSI